MKQYLISVIIPVYRGELSLNGLVEEISEFFLPVITDGGHQMMVSEIFLVHDCGPDRSDVVINRLAETYPQVKPLWLTRNFGQHPATLAGMSSATGDWIVTMDEDGQHDPQDIARLLDYALDQDLQLVYAKPLNQPPHGFVRNYASRMAKRIGRVMMGNDIVESFNSFRLVRGDIGRSLAAYCGDGVFLDIGLLWVAGRIGCCRVTSRSEVGRPSGYSASKLLQHFWRMMLTAGNRPLRLITLMGFFSLAIAFILGIYAIYVKMSGTVQVQGWTSLVIIVSFFSGCILMSLGMIAEYLAVSMGIAMGRPLYVIGSRSSRMR